MTVEGRSEDTTKAIVESPARLGVESSNDYLAGYTPSFIDFPFTDPDATFADHLRVVRDTKPSLTVAPDIEQGRTLAEVVTKADILSQYSDSVIVVPKSVHPSEVPDRFRVGVPLADYGSGAPWGAWDYRDCRSLHLLGGGPARQQRAARALPPDRIDSLDTATLGKVSRFGYWNEGTTDALDHWDYRRRLRESLTHYVAAWQ